MAIKKIPDTISNIFGKGDLPPRPRGWIVPPEAPGRAIPRQQPLQGRLQSQKRKISGPLFGFEPSIPGFKKGGKVKKTGIYKLHKGEKIIPKSNPGTHRKHTPIVSKAQRGAMGAAYAAKVGEMPVKELRGVSKQMYKSMPAAELRRHLKESKGKRLVSKVKKTA